jgi:hypothetical protein
LYRSESAVSGGAADVLLLLPPKEGMKEKRRELLFVLPSLLVFFRENEKDVLLESVERRGSASMGMGFILTGGCEREGFSLGAGASLFSDLSLLPPKKDPRLPKSSPNVLERLCPRLLDALRLGSLAYWSEALES